MEKNNEPLDTESARTLQLLKKESSNPESQSIKIVETNSRTPHGKYAAYSKARGMLRIDAWNEFKQLAVKCTQTNEPVDLPGFGKIFLKLDYKNPDSSIRYKMTAFEGKNDPGKKTTKKAWELIKDSGCINLRVGGAKLSNQHCNFFVNEGNATSKDIELLIESVKDKVYLKTGIKLDLEIKIVGEN